jgi:hypothetical protein
MGSMTKTPLRDSLRQGCCSFLPNARLQSDVLDSGGAILAKGVPEVISLRDVLDYSYGTPVTYYTAMHIGRMGCDVG